MPAHPVFALSAELVDEIAALSPTDATYAGLVGHDHRWPDLSPEGHDETRRALDTMRTRANHLPSPEDRWDALAFEALGSFVGDRIDWYEAGDHLRDLDSIASPAQTIVEVFDHMDTASAAGWSDICARLETMPDVLAGHQETLAAGLATIGTVAIRQVHAVAEQADTAASADGALATLPADLAASGAATATLATRLEEAVATARAAQAEFAAWLRAEYLPQAVPEDAVGEERYTRAARRFLGMDIKPVETYEWGWSEVAALRARMKQVADEISPGASIPEALTILKSDPARAAATRADFIKFMEGRNAAAVERLSGTYFDVPDSIRHVDIKLAKPGGALGAYYVGPSEDFTRPGAVWWSKGAAAGPFPLYDEVSTLYHEGFPGHHLQVGTQVAQADKLSRLHRLLVWYPGLGEGWALYAERVMEQLGFLDKPDYVFGYLAAQMLRACRVVIDIGSHLELPIPRDQHFHPGESWTFETGVAMLREYATLEQPYAESEMTRYLGWPGQAIAYKVGEKAILDMRRELERRGDFDERRFHADLLEIGPVGLDYVRQMILG